MALVVTIAGSAANIQKDSLSIEKDIDERSSATFTVLDATGATHYQRGQTVTISDTNVSFTGYVYDVEEQRLVPGTTLASNIRCTDERYLADNILFIGNEYNSRTAGDIFSDIASSHLSAEGVVANFAVDHDNSQATFATGTLSNLTATSTDLEISPKGTTYTKTETSTADFATGTLTNVTAANNQLQISSVTALKLEGTASSSLTDCYTYRKIWSGLQTVAAGDTLRYDMWISSTSPEFKAGVSLICTDGSNFGSTAAGDQFNISAAPTSDLSGFANDQWFSRTIDMTPFAGKTISLICVALEGNSAGPYAVYFKNIQLWNSTPAVKASFFTTSRQTDVQINNVGYANAKTSVVTAYLASGNRVSPSYSITAPGIAKTSLISWSETDVTQPSSNASSEYPAQVLIETSLDGGATWSKCTNHQPIPYLLAGMNTSTLTIRQTLSVGGPSPELAPTLQDLTISISPSYNATKSDAKDTDMTTTDWSGGSGTNLTAGNNSLYISGQYRNWDDANIASQTVYSTGNPVQQASYGGFAVRCDTGTDVRSRFDFAGQFQNFVMECDILLFDSSGNYGLLYRCSNWQNNNDTYAYNAYIDSVSIRLGRGTNSASGTGTYTEVARTNLTLQTGSWYRMKVIANGTTHQVFLNDVMYINITDSTYNISGYVGIRHYNNSGSRHSGTFDNFGIMGSTSLTGTRTITTISNASLAPVGTVLNSLILWQSSEPAGTSVVINVSLDGGSTWTACTNGAVIPGLTPGTSIGSKSVQLQQILTTNNANITPALYGCSVWVLGAFSATGTRVSPVLSLNSIGRCGSSSVTWIATTPTGTTLTVATSPDNVTYTTVTNGGSIPGINGQPDPTVDTFPTNSSANYTSTFKTGGSVATWTWDTTNVRLAGSGGSQGILLNSSLSTKDIDLYVDMSQSDGGGILWRYQDQSNFYALEIFDGSSSGGATNVLRLTKVIANTRTQIGSDIAISFTRGTYHRIRVSMLSTAITVSFDGTQVASTTDSGISSAGKCGVRNNGGTAYYYQLWLQPQGDDLTGKNVYTRVTMTGSSTDPTVTPTMVDLSVSVRATDLQTGATIPTTSYQYQNMVSACFDDLAQKSNYWWSVKNKRLKFQSRPALPAPFPIASADIIGVPVLKNNSSKYRNQQWIRGGFDTSTLLSETKTGDGFAQSWPLFYPVATVTPSTPAPVITRNGVAQTVGVAGTDTGKDFYYQADSNVISQDPSETPLGSTESITVQYYGQIPVVVSANGFSQQTALAAIQGGSGIVAAVESVDGLNKSAAQQLATARITQYAVLSRIITFTTQRGGLDAGQMLPLFLPEHGITNGQFLITKIGIRVQQLGSGSLLYSYDVEATDGPNPGSWTKLFAALGQE